MSLGAKLKELRLRRGQSLQQVADAIGASKAHVFGLETEQVKNPSFGILKRLANHFKVSVEDLVEDEFDAQEEDGSLVAMFRDLKTLNEDDLQIVKSVLESIKMKTKAKLKDK